MTLLQDAYDASRSKNNDAEMIDVPVLENTYPLVLYLGSEEDREELIQAIMQVNPNLKARKL